MTHEPKMVDGVIAQEFDAEEVFDEHSVTLAFIKMFQKEGRIALMWSPVLFCNPAIPMPDELRKQLIEMLRFHADRLEDRTLDERMRQIHGNMTGAA